MVTERFFVWRNEAGNRIPSRQSVCRRHRLTLSLARSFVRRPNFFVLGFSQCGNFTLPPSITLFGLNNGRREGKKEGWKEGRPQNAAVHPI